MNFIIESFKRSLFENVTYLINYVFSGFKVFILIWLTMAILQRLYFNFTFIILIFNILITFLQLLFVIIVIPMLGMYLKYILEDNYEQFGDWLLHKGNLYPTDKNCLNKSIINVTTVSLIQNVKELYKKYIDTNIDEPNQTNPNEGNKSGKGVEDKEENEEKKFIIVENEENEDKERKKKEELFSKFISSTTNIKINEGYFGLKEE